MENSRVRLTKWMTQEIENRFGKDHKISMYFRIMVKGYLNGAITFVELDNFYRKALDTKVKL